MPHSANTLPPTLPTWLPHCSTMLAALEAEHEAIEAFEAVERHGSPRAAKAIRWWPKAICVS